MNRYNVKVNDQIYQVEVADVEANTTNNEESSASICFEAIKAEYDYCVTRAEKLENKVCTTQEQQIKRKLVLEQSGSGDTEQ